MPPAVVMPYTRVGQFPEAEQAALGDGHDLLKVDVSGSDDAYWELLSSLWAQRETVVVVEHDVVIPPGAVDELLACPRPWCSFAIDYVGMKYAGLSCAKLEGALMARHPDAMDAVAEMHDDGHPAKHWCRLDAWLQAVLRGRGEELHEHHGGLVHVRRDGGAIMPAHNCW